MTQVNRSLVTPRWLLLHLLFLAATIATGFLAWWQWSRAQEAGGGAQNLGYALMWPMFGLFTIFMWYRLIQMEPKQDDEPAASEPEAQPPEPVTMTSKRPLLPPQAPPVGVDEDPELSAYNAYLAELNRAEDGR